MTRWSSENSLLARLPSERITRCHGRPDGHFRMAHPTILALPGLPIIQAICPETGYLSLGNSAYDFIDLGKEGVIHVAFSQIAASVESASESTLPFTWPVIVPSVPTTTTVGSPSMGISACLANFPALERNNTPPRSGAVSPSKLSASPLRIAPRTKKGAPSMTEMW